MAEYIRRCSRRQGAYCVAFEKSVRPQSLIKGISADPVAPRWTAMPDTPRKRRFEGKACASQHLADGAHGSVDRAGAGRSALWMICPTAIDAEEPPATGRGFLSSVGTT
jgi:hypothetical protein